MQRLPLVVLVLMGCTNVASLTSGRDADVPDLAMPDLTMGDLTAVFPMGCMDGAQDGDETDIDCGGSCKPCDTGKGCARGKDCLSTFCTNKLCDAPSCMDGVKNGTESDVDCGGTCPGCAI